MTEFTTADWTLSFILLAVSVAGFWFSSTQGRRHF